MSAKVKILVFEDSRLDAELLKVILTMGPYSLEVIQDGKKASDYIKNNSPPDIVLTDINLPHVNGLQLIEQIRKNNIWKSVPVIALSSNINTQIVVSVKKQGASAILAKPFQPERLQQEIFKLTGYERIE